MGNLGSVENALRRIGQAFHSSSSPAELSRASALILPGVGSFDRAMQQLQSRGLIEELERKVLGDRTPILGICLGLQMMTLSSEEGRLPGLGWLPFKTLRIQAGHLPLPHIGWNTLVCSPQRNSLLRGLDTSQSRFYFLHSYQVDLRSPDPRLTAWTDYQGEVPAVICSNHITGVQFHPEKSSHWGEMLLRNFCDQWLG